MSSEVEHDGNLFIQRLRFCHLISDACSVLWLPATGSNTHFLLENKMLPGSALPSLECLSFAALILVQFLCSVSLRPLRTNTFCNISIHVSWCYVEITNPCTFVSSPVPKYMFSVQLQHPEVSLEEQNIFPPYHLKGGVLAGGGQADSCLGLGLSDTQC